MLKKISIILFVALTLHVEAFSQNEFYNLSPIQLNDLSAFKNPAKNWVLKGNVSGSFDSAQPKAEKGSGTLVNEFNEGQRTKPESNLFTQLEHGDIFLSLDFMVPKGSNSGVYLQGRYEIQLFESWGVRTPHVTDCGSIYERWNDALPEGKRGYEGHPARTNASLAPNLWQHLEIEFRAPRFDANGKKTQLAEFVKVSLNGVVIHEHVLLTGPTRASAFNDEKAVGPIVIQGDHGPIAFRNIQYALLDEFKVSFSELKYEYYEGDFNDFPKVEPRHLVRKGDAEAIDVKLADNPNKMCLVFTGKITLKENTTYQFIIKKIGKAKLSIDGEEVVRTRGLFEDYVVSRKLDAGEHTIVFSYLKDFSWAPTGVGFYIGKLNSRPLAMHTPASLPPLPPTPLIDVRPAAEPEIIRSFMMFEGKKKTHVISVGDPSGVHYSYDLTQAALLQLWNGEFLNVTEMWYERGEPQVAASMGATIRLTGTAPFGIVKDKSAALPDTLNDRTELLYKGYSLDAHGYPTFAYAYKNVAIKDSFKPLSSGRGVSHSVSIAPDAIGAPATDVLLIRLGEGGVISEVSDNVFAIDDQRYYIQFAPTGKLKPFIRSVGSKKELVVQLSAVSTAEITYSLLW